MFVLRRYVGSYDDESIEHILGLTLAERNNIIPNSVFVDKQYEINRIVGFSPQRLSDELDFVAVHYAYKYFMDRGISLEKLDETLSIVFERFVKEGVLEKDEQIRVYRLMISRVRRYLHERSDARIGAIFMFHVVEGHNMLGDNVGRGIAPILKHLKSNLRRMIDAELNAGR